MSRPTQSNGIPIYKKAIKTNNSIILSPMLQFFLLKLTINSKRYPLEKLHHKSEQQDYHDLSSRI